jgi:hypothetical protein
MPRVVFPFEVADISAFARSLRDQFDRLGHPPSHVEMLNLLCRATGFRNYQHFRADAEARDRIRSAEAAALPDLARVEKAARHFDREGRMTSFPARVGLQELGLWVIWSRLPAKVAFTEREIGDFLDRQHTFSDRALMRRALCDFGLADRTRDGSEYRRRERKPPAELRALLERIGAPEVPI